WRLPRPTWRGSTRLAPGAALTPAPPVRFLVVHVVQESLVTLTPDHNDHGQGIRAAPDVEADKSDQDSPRPASGDGKDRGGSRFNAGWWSALITWVEAVAR